jgi:hypothetical protein
MVMGLRVISTVLLDFGGETCWVIDGELQVWVSMGLNECTVERWFGFLDEDD